jgi:branched-chain amino acid transport system permease protein
MIRTLRENGLYLLVLVGLIALPHLIGLATGSSPLVRRGEAFYWMSIIIEIFSVGILVMSYNLMFGFTGVISFGHAMFFGLGGYIVGMMLQFTQIEQNLAFFLGVLIVLAVCGVIGLLIGLATLRLRGVYFAIFTLAVAEMVWIYFGRLTLTGGDDGFAITNRLPAWIDPVQSRINLYYIALFLFALTFFIIRRLVKSPVGSVFMAIRENEERARALGYDTLRYKLISITIAAMMAGMAGIIHSVLAKKVGPEVLGVSYTVDALLMTIIGGVGTFTGPVLGAAGLELADVFVRRAEFNIGGLTIDLSSSWTLILGFIFILAVIVFPYGVVGTWNRLRTRLNTRKALVEPKPTPVPAEGTS